MNIHHHMHLTELAERMGTEATLREAHEMRIILCDGPYQTTQEIPEEVWNRLVDEAVDAAADTVLE